jgi:hypothetical protein
MQCVEIGIAVDAQDDGLAVKNGGDQQIGGHRYILLRVPRCSLASRHRLNRTENATPSSSRLVEIGLRAKK